MVHDFFHVISAVIHFLFSRNAVSLMSLTPGETDGKVGVRKRLVALSVLREGDPQRGTCGARCPRLVLCAPG